MHNHGNDSGQLPFTKRDIQPALLTKPKSHGPNNPLPFVTKCWHLVARLRRTLVYRWWWFELSALTVSILSMMAVIYILCRINNVALDQWTFPIQANSLVSVFLTISKSALLVSVAECISQAKWMQFYKKPLRLSRLQEYDDASRGPFGAFTLLFKKAGWIAWVGAFLTVAALALDPFVQQIIDFPTRQVALPSGLAEVAAARSINKIDIPSMRGAILSAIYSPTQDPAAPLTYTCTTSSCLWNQTISSIGICSVCHDITESFAPECTITPGPRKPENTDQNWSIDTTTCVYKIDPAKNISLTVYLQTLTLPAADGKPAEYASQYTQVKVVATKGYGGSHVGTPLTMAKLVDPKVRWISTAMTFTTTYDKDRKVMPKMTIEELAPELHICGLYLCAQSYDHSLAVINGSITNALPSTAVPLGNTYRQSDGRAEVTDIGDGQVAEVLVLQPDSTLINYGNLSSTSSTADFSAETVDVSPPSRSPPYHNSTMNTTLVSANTTVLPRSRLSRHLTFRQVPPPFPSSLPTASNSSASAPNYTISQQTLFALQGRLNREILNISQTSGNIDFSDSVFPSPNYGVDLSALIAAQSSSSFSAASGTEQSFVNVSSTFERLARGITGRLWVEDGAERVQGQAMVEETYFRVAWGWVALPVGVVLLAGGLLGVTIWESRPRAGTRGTAEGGRDGEKEDGVGDMTVNGSASGAKKVRFKLEETGNPAELEGANPGRTLSFGDSDDTDGDSMHGGLPGVRGDDGEKQEEKEASSGEREGEVRYKAKKEAAGRGGPGIWKGGILPLLMADLTMEDGNGEESRGFREELSRVRNREDLERFAQSKHVQLKEVDSPVDGGTGGTDGGGPHGRRLVFVGKY